MDGRISRYVLCALCSLDAWRLMTAADAQPTVNATILTPLLDRREGGQVDITCVAMNLEEDHIVEWAIKDDSTKNTTLRWGNMTLTSINRYEYTTSQANGLTIQNLTITNLQGSDADEYICNVNDPISSGGNNVVASDRVTLFVLDSNFQFPNDSFPMCSPDGPITLDTGTELNMRCSSEGTNSAIKMEVSLTPSASKSFTWTPSTTADTLSMSLDLTVDTTHDGMSFVCVISSVPHAEVRRSCRFGPLSVTEPTTEPTEITPPRSPPGNTAAIAGGAAGGVAALLLVLILILIYRRRGMICSKDSSKSQNSGIPTNKHSQSQLDTNKDLQVKLDHVSRPGIYQIPTHYDVPVADSPLATPGTSPNMPAHTYMMYAKPNINKPCKPGNKHDVVGTEQNHNNPAFDPLAVMKNEKTPPKPRPYSSKSKTDKHAMPSPPPDSKNSTQKGGLIGGEPNQPRSDEVSYASISSPLQIHDDTEKQTPSSKPVVYADLNLQPESPPNDGQYPSPPVYATVNKS